MDCRHSFFFDYGLLDHLHIFCVYCCCQMKKLDSNWGNVVMVENMIFGGFKKLCSDSQNVFTPYLRLIQVLNFSWTINYIVGIKERDNESSSASRILNLTSINKMHSKRKCNERRKHAFKFGRFCLMQYHNISNGNINAILTFLACRDI